MHEFTFDVELINHESGNYQLYNYEDAKKVAKWFGMLTHWNVGKENDEDFSYLSFKPLRNGSQYKIQCTFELNNDQDIEYMENFIIDPDDDGNHPITLGDIEYLVMGFKDTDSDK